MPAIDSLKLDEALHELQYQRAVVEAQQLKRDAAVMESQARWAEFASREVFAEEMYLGSPQFNANYIDPKTPYYDTPGMIPGLHGFLDQPTMLEDFKEGDYRPFWQSLHEYRAIQGIARYFGVAAYLSKKVTGVLTDYCIHKGFAYSVRAKNKKDESEATGALVDECQKIIDEFSTRTNFCCIRESQIFHDSIAGGEQFIQITRLGEGKAGLEIRPAINITEPDQQFHSDLEEIFNLPAGSCWKYGVIRAPQSKEVLGYYFDPDFTGVNYEFLPADEVTHIKLNVPDEVKRGLTGYFPVFDLLRILPKVLRSTIVGTALQATIAYIRKHTAGDATISNLGSTIQRPSLYGDSRTYQPQAEGQILDVAGMEYEAGPLGNNNAEAYTNVFDAGARIVGAFYGVPEYMTTGRADTANRATAETSETPFIRGNERRQMSFAPHFKEIHWQVLDIAARAGLLIQHGIRTREDLEELIALDVEPPEVRSKKAKDETTRLIELNKNKIISKRTIQEKEGVDPDRELKRLTEEAENEVLNPPPILGPDGQPFGKDQPDEDDQDNSDNDEKESGESSESVTSNLTEDDRRDIAARILYEGYP